MPQKGAQGVYPPSLEGAEGHGPSKRFAHWPRRKCGRPCPKVQGLETFAWNRKKKFKEILNCSPQRRRSPNLLRSQSQGPSPIPRSWIFLTFKPGTKEKTAALEETKFFTRGNALWETIFPGPVITIWEYFLDQVTNFGPESVSIKLG